MNALDLVFRTVLDISWRASWLILLALALGACFRSRLAPRVIFGVWIVVALRLLVPLSIPATWSPFNLAGSVVPTTPTPRAISPAVLTPLASTPAPTTSQISPRQAAAAAAAPRALAPSSPAPARGLSVFAWAAIAWLAGVVILLSLRAGAYLAFARRLRRAGPPDMSLPGEVLSALGAGSTPIPIVVTTAVPAPVLHGIFRPRILLPPECCAQLGPHELRLTIAHELAHARRRDLLAEALIHLAVTLHWFNPLAWLAARAARRDCELACDAHVLHGVEDDVRQSYGSTLLRVAQLVRGASPSFTLGVAGGRHEIRERIETIVANRPFTSFGTFLGIALCAVLTGLSLTSQSAAQSALPSGRPSATSGETVGAPPGWWKNGRNPENYVAGVDSLQTRGGGPSSYVRSIREATDSFGGMMQTTPAENYIGKRIRMTAWVKTEEANDGGGHLWLRIDGQERGKTLGFDNMGDRPIKGTSDWQEASIVLDVPVGAVSLAYGFFVQGNGRMWVSGQAISVVGSDTPPTGTTRVGGWYKNGKNPGNYAAGVDPLQTRGGEPSAYVRSIQEASGSFGGMMQTTPAENYIGKRVRLAAWVKTEDANDGGGHLWLRIDGEQRGQMLGFDNMDNRPVNGTADWQEASIVLDVPPGAVSLAYGFFVSGNGKMWVSGHTLAEVGSDVPTTNMYPGRR